MRKPPITKIGFPFCQLCKILRACNHSRSRANGWENSYPVGLKYNPSDGLFVNPEAGSNPLALARYPSRTPNALAAARGTAVHGRIAVDTRGLCMHHAVRRDGHDDDHEYIGGRYGHGLNMPADEAHGCWPGAMCQALRLRCVCPDLHSSAVCATQCSSGPACLVAVRCCAVVADDRLPTAT